MKKRFMSVLLAVCLMLTLLQGTALASETDGTLELAEGNHVLWIGRLQLPDYARNFYDLLVEASDNDGYNDYLIEDQYADFSSGDVITESSELSSLNIGDYVKINTPTDGGRASWAGILVAVSSETESENADKYIRNSINAVWQAFSMDCPEVFWIQGYIRIWTWGPYYFVAFFEPEQAVETAYRAVADGMKLESHTIVIDPFAPEIQPLSDTGFSFSVRDTDENGYVYTEATLKAEIAERDRNISRILNTIPLGASRYEQIRALNRWLVENNEYNSIIAAGDDADRTGIPKSVWECVGALAGRTGEIGPVCQSYAKAFQTLCKKLGIPCVFTRLSGHHGWNYVQMGDGKWYGVDVTWNDPTGVNGGKGTEQYLLVYNDQIVDEKNNITFIQEHHYNNKIWLVGDGEETLNLTNGPEEGPDAATGPYVVKPGDETKTMTYRVLINRGLVPNFSDPNSISILNGVPGIKLLEKLSYADAKYEVLPGLEDRAHWMWNLVFTVPADFEATALRVNIRPIESSEEPRHEPIREW